MMDGLITSQWFWLGAAGFFAALLGLTAYVAGHARRAGGGADEGGWVPTGRIDFIGPTRRDPGTPGKFELQAEEIRVANSIGGLDHHEVRWRGATLREAKNVVTIYHAHAKFLRSPLVASPASIVPEPDAARTSDMNQSRVRPIAVVKAST
jgi:hypothetical protein